jgi:hypothetical protein
MKRILLVLHSIFISAEQLDKKTLDELDELEDEDDERVLQEYRYIFFRCYFYMMLMF